MRWLTFHLPQSRVCIRMRIYVRKCGTSSSLRYTAARQYSRWRWVILSSTSCLTTAGYLKTAAPPHEILPRTFPSLKLEGQSFIIGQRS
ncbi:hypothetical protein OBBRIDRAFT_214099 [Obba rivulosa]|uniref:Uncharacterized protein n=1 Tax=Obba rivulosa TaxID=1052685 RepID=A0A8E2AQR5_9APHY|nr:hypothetical protein OBBRIDRAFT_214099 [Obba rivulosa]